MGTSFLQTSSNHKGVSKEFVNGKDTIALAHNPEATRLEFALMADEVVQKTRSLTNIS